LRPAVETVNQVAAFVGRHADAQHPTFHGAPYLQFLPNANMTAFFMRCRKKTQAALLLALLCLASVALSAWAGSIEPQRASISPGDDNYTLAAEFNIDLGRRLEDVVAHGIPLYFELEVVLERPRKYWVNEHIVTRNLTYRLSYHSLTRQYRLAQVSQVSSGSLYQNFSSLADVLRVLSRISALPIVERHAIVPGKTYMASLRLSLDRSQLPKPFQLDAMTDADWNVASKTLQWKFVAPVTPP
jgi:hypothetical protein